MQRPLDRGSGETMAEKISVVRPQGRLDSATSPDFEADVLGRIDNGARALLLDFSQLTYISSAGLRTVLLAAKRMKGTGGRLALCALGKQAAEVFEISGFNSILDVHPTYAAALARVSTG